MQKRRWLVAEMRVHKRDGLFATFRVAHERRATSEHLIKDGSHRIKVCTAIDLPGTPLLRLAEERGLVRPGIWSEFARHPTSDFEPPIWDEHLNKEQLYSLLDEAYRSFYLRPSVILAQLRSGGLQRKVRAGLQMISSKLGG